MKQWKLVLVALLAVLLVCTSVTALAAETCTHSNTTTYYTGAVDYEYDSAWQHKMLREQETKCVDCDKVIKTEWVEEKTEACSKSEKQYIKEPTCTEAGKYTVYCTLCGKESDVTEEAALGHKTGKQVKETEPECGKDGNIAYYTCERCGKNFDSENPAADATPLTTVVPAEKKMQAPEHTWAIKATEAAATCTEKGKVTYECVNCGKIKSEDVDPLGHLFDDTKWELIEDAKPSCLKEGTEVNTCLRCAGAEDGGKIYRPVEKTDHTWAAEPADLVKKTVDESVANQYEIIKPSDCENEGSGYIYCTVCGTAKSVVIPAAGHDWNDWEVKEYEEDLTDETVCEPGRYAIRKCKVAGCKGEETKHIADTVYHVFENTEGTDATCTEDGLLKGKCIVCGKEIETVVPAYGHEYEWIVVAEPSKDGDGVEELTCIWCGDVADVRVTPYTDMRYGTTITSFGPCTRDLIGGKTWNRVTPIDLSVEGTFTYPLIASNEFNVGTMTVTIKDGKATVSYKLNSTQIKVKSESLVIFNNLEALRAGTGVAAAINAPVEVAQFEDGKVIIALKLVADYNAVGAGVRDFSADASQISAMTGIID